MRQIAVVLVASTLGCGSSDTVQPGDANALKAGEWEITTSVGEMSIVGMSPADQARLRTAVEAQEPARRCLRGGTPSVGDIFMDDECRYTQVSDRGATIDRVVICPRPERAILERVELTGTRSPERYTLRIFSRRIEARSGQTRSSAETTEEGRWIGACEEGATPE